MFYFAQLLNSNEIVVKVENYKKGNYLRNDWFFSFVIDYFIFMFNYFLSKK